jgi:hypothetical protein
MSDLTAAIPKGRQAYMSVSERVLGECRVVGTELSKKPPGVLKLLCPLLVAGFLKLIADYDRSVRQHKTFRDSERQLSVCTAAFRCALSRVIERFDTVNMSNKFGRFMILQNLDCVPELLEFSVSMQNLVDETANLATAIQHLKRLQVFKYPTYCTDEVIFQLRLHCPRLAEVDVSHSANVTNASAPHIIQLTELKLLHLAGTQIDGENYGFIISKLPNIACIGFWQYWNSVLFHNGMEKLDRITHISGRFHDMDALSQMCPNTTNISLFSDLRDLSSLTALNALRALELCNIPYDRSNLNVVLRDIGHRLQDLTLLYSSSVNLQDIVTLCPSLVNLSLRRCTFLHFNTPFDPQLPHFRNLININVKTNHRDLTDFRHIRYYVSLETIYFSMVSIFTVEFVREIISLGTFTQLKVFNVQERWPGTLTMKALQLLIRHCPQLKRIEGLINCPRLDNLAIRKLKRQILKQNFDLAIEY